MPDKKPIGLLAMFGKPKSDAGDSPRRLAAQGVLDAIADKDVAALEDALATFADAGSSGPEPEAA